MLVVGAAILRGSTCLVAQRAESMREPGKWEFPGGKVETGETPEEALARELREELGVTVRVGPHAGQGRAGAIVLDVYFASVLAGEPVAHEHARLAWLSADELETLDWAEADVPIMRSVAARLRRA